MKILILGYTGKLGSALMRIFSDYNPIGKNSSDFDATDFNQVKELIIQNKPDIVINCIAKMGMDYCENHPTELFMINSLFPRKLAELSNEFEFTLIHFSTDNVLPDSDGSYITEDVAPKPMNVYGITKYAADLFIQAIAKKCYIFRIPLVFGVSSKCTAEHERFVENILYRIENGEKEIKIADDNITSPSYSIDIACMVKDIVINGCLPYGLYHIANEGKVSLYEFTKKLLYYLDIDIKVTPIKYSEFTNINRNKCNPIMSTKIEHHLRDWQLALIDYCEELRRLNGR